jgi:hypothetical protein
VKAPRGKRRIVARGSERQADGSSRHSSRPAARSDELLRVRSEDWGDELACD